MRHRLQILLFLATLGVVVAAPARGADEDWHQVSDFPAAGLHAFGNTVVAWDQLRYAVSLDGGQSWSNAVAIASGGLAQGQPLPVHQAVVAASGPVVLAQTGVVLGVAGGRTAPLGLPAASALAVDGAGRLWIEGVDGTIAVLDGVVKPIGRGRIYRALDGGVLAQTGGKDLVLLTPAGAQQVETQTDQLPPVFQLAPLTGKGGDRWVTKAGASWTLAHGKVASTSDRPVKILSYGFAADGYHDLVVWKGLQISVINHGALAPQRRTRHLPATATLLGMTADRFVAATPEGLWTVPIEPTNGPGPVPTR
jgi:hypothetical protein